MTKIIDGAFFAKELLLKLQSKISALNTNYNVQPALRVIIVGDNPASQIYVKNKQKKADSIGIDAKTISLPSKTTETELLDEIEKNNQDPKVSGILVQLPLPKHIKQKNVIAKIADAKDVDCFTKQNVGALWTQKSCMIKPCTPAGCMYLIKRYLGDDISGAEAVVIGRSNIVGKPMAGLLLQESCTVTIAHSKTKNIEEKLKNADIIVAAVGVPKFLKGKHIKQGATVIDVGINRLKDGSITGDADFEDLQNKAGFITPVPKGVGPMTIAFLMVNTTIACCVQNKIEMQFNDI